MWLYIACIELGFEAIFNTRPDSKPSLICKMVLDSNKYQRMIMDEGHHDELAS